MFLPPYAGLFANPTILGGGTGTPPLALVGVNPLGGIGYGFSGSANGSSWSATDTTLVSQIWGILKQAATWFIITGDKKLWTAPDNTSPLVFTDQGTLDPLGTHPAEILASNGSYFLAAMSTGRVCKSPDNTGLGVWTSAAVSGATGEPVSLIWDGAQWVLLRDSGQCFTSPDGEAPWTAQTTVNGATRLAYINACYLVGFSFGGTKGIKKSTDLSSYSLVINTGLGTINDLIVHDTRVVALSSDGSIYTSDDDGDNWSLQTSGVATPLYRGAWNAALSLYVVVGAAGVIITSPDALTWTVQTSGISDPIRVVGL